jgi:uncharacterized protein GlcG (DUF336 family)
MFCNFVRRTPGFVAVALSLLLLGSFARSASAVQVNIDSPIPNDVPPLTVDDVNTIIAQAVGYMKANSVSGIVAVVDREGHILGIFRMTQSAAPDIRINEQATVKARTACFFQSDNNAFTTRTAGFIVQSNFPPGIRNLDAGPLYGVPFSNFPKLNPLDVASQVQLQVPPFIVFVPGVNVKDATTGAAAAIPPGNSNQRPTLQPLVITPLTDDLGGIPLFKNGRAVGGIGVEIDAFGILQEGIPDKGVERTPIATSKAALEEQAALAGAKGFLPPQKIRANKILINGFRFLFTGKARGAKRGSAVPVASLPSEGAFEPYNDTNGAERLPQGGALANAYAVPTVLSFNTPVTSLAFTANSVTLTGVRATPTQEFPRQGFVPRFPPRNSPLGAITADDVRKMVQQAANRASETRAGIRNPKGEPEQVWICVTDLAGNICGSFRTEDATPFSFDVHVQKARTAAFFSNNKVGFSSRGVGFISQTFYPPGIDKSPSGPISGLLNVDESKKDAGSLGLTPTGGTGRMLEISQLLVDTTGPEVLAHPRVAAQATLGGKLGAAVQVLAERMPHVRDGRLSPLQLCISVDLTLGRNSTTAVAPVPTAIPNGITIFAGGVPIYKGGVLVGGLGVSGGGIDQDDFIAAGGQVGFEPPAGVRCDEASDADIIACLKETMVKIKTQFPNLTNGSSYVVDVIEARLNNGNKVLQDLRIPYVKFPRQPFRETGKAK